MVRKKLSDAMAQFVADRRPGRAGVEVADVMGHEAGARRKNGEIQVAFLHLGQLVGPDAFAQFVVADVQVAGARPFGRITQRRHPPVAPVFERLRRRRSGRGCR